MFTRQAYERVVQHAEAVKLEATRALLRGSINGFEKSTIDREMDGIIEKAANKLAGTRLALQDKELAIRSNKVCFVLTKKSGWLKKQGSSRWRPTDSAEVQRLRAAGIKVVFMKAKRDADGNVIARAASFKRGEPSVEYHELPWQEVDQLAYQRISKRIGSLTKTEGEGQQQKYFACIWDEEDEEAPVVVAEPV